MDFFLSVSQASNQLVWWSRRKLDDSVTDTNTARPDLAASFCSRPHCTVRFVEPQIVPAHALIVAVPTATARTAPRLVTSLVICATFVPDTSVELHVTAESCCMLMTPLILNVPLAVNCSVAPGTSVADCGVTAIETRFAGEGVSGGRVLGG